MKRPARPPLAETAEDFLSSLETTLKPSTCSHYRLSLRLLHDWLDSKRLRLKTFNREQAVQWLAYLASRGTGTGSRLMIILYARGYLRALNEAGLLRAAADTLLRRADMPKLPVYLPRPFSQASDRELQRRLANSSQPYHRGLLLMRHTGLRIGELSGLTLNCMRQDELGHTFLKVPLGKMNTERLVPLNEETVSLVKELQRAGRPHRELLLETPRGRRTDRGQLRAVLCRVAAGIDIDGKVTTHRLRHTYATTLMNAGVSLPVIMKLLGHRDYRMTLRYTNITLETVGREYRAALSQLETRYRLALTAAEPTRLEPGEALGDIIRWLQKRTADEEQRKTSQALVKRLRRIRTELGDL